MTVLNLDNIPKPEEVVQKVQKDGFLICKNVIDDTILKELQDYWLNSFTKLNYSSLNKYYRSFVFRLGDENFWSLSDKKNDDYRVKRQEFLWNDMHETTRLLITEMHQFSNICLNRKKDSGLYYGGEKNALTLSVNYYPNENGFLSEHKDASDSNMLLWMIFNLTFKGQHFEEGGLYIIDEKNNKINLDDLSGPGSILFFNGTLRHGVDKIISKGNIGKISVFPFNAFFLNQSTIPRPIKNLIKLYNKIEKILGVNKEKKIGLKY